VGADQQRQPLERWQQPEDATMAKRRALLLPERDRRRRV
jgi:hypothetical protein